MFKKINLSDVYTGTIKLCNDFDKYQRYGEVEFIPSFKSAHSIEGITSEIVGVVEDNAYLISRGNGKYTPIGRLSKLSSGFVLTTEPLFSSDIFVDKSTLRPVFENSGEKLSIRKLVKKINGLK